MKYIWNVAKQQGSSYYDGKHHPTYRYYCRIEHDYHNEQGKADFLKQLRLAFPAPEYKIDLTRWQESGYHIDLPEEETV